MLPETPPRRRLRVPRAPAGRAASGFAWGEIPAELDERLPTWLARWDVPGGDPIKPGSVYRWRGYLVKLTPARKGLRHLGRASAAVRSALRHEALRPIRSPRPYVALDVPEPGGGPRGLLVTEFIEGRFLEEVWRAEPLAMDRFVDFLVTMHARRVFHGDFHFHNAIWSGEHWYLIDLEGLRHPLRTLFPRRLILDHWARIHFCLALPDDLEPHFRRYLARARLAWDPDEAWGDVAALAQAFVARWGAPPAQPNASG